MSIVAVLLVATLAPSAGAATGRPYPFRNPRLPVTQRVTDLLSRLTLDEKIGLLHQSQAAIPRLGIQYFKTGTEALHGVGWSNDLNSNWSQVYASGTVFPQPVGLASTWDTGLIRRVGSAVGDEARGYNAQNPVVWGLNLWSPVVNPLRDPRWGRNEEGYSEDPVLTSAIATAYGTGLQGDDPRYLKTAPTLKHYLAYNNEAGRVVSSSNVPPRVLNEYDRQAFGPTLAAGAATGVMTSYNLINGRPSTVDPDLAGRGLFNVTDAGGANNLVFVERYYPTQAAAVAAAIKAGVTSFTADNSNSGPTVTAIQSALVQGLLSTKDIESAVRAVLTVRCRLGQFDPDGGPYAKTTPAVIDSPAHRQLNRQAADEATVLLKNDAGTLPLDPGHTRKVAVVGPLSDVLYPDWYGGNLPYQVTPLDGIKERLGSRGTVAASEGTDRIALRDLATGRFVTATGTGDANAVTESATASIADSQFDVTDWGQSVLTLRSAANGHYLGYGNGALLTRDVAPNGWYVQQQFMLEPQPDGAVLLRYAGYDTHERWFGPNTYVTLGAGSALTLGPASGAARFAKEVVRDGVAEAVDAARNADAAVVVVGSQPFINGREAHDRTSMALSDGQERLVRAVRAVNPHTVVVLETSYPDTITWEQEHVPAIMWTTHAGAETGHAVADVLFGDVNPSGHLTQTWYRSQADLPPNLLDYDIINSGQTYLYYRGTPLYPFGYGLSYTSFRYANLRTSRSVDGTVNVTVDVTNTGTRSGADVVQIYTHQNSSRDPQPVKALHGFQRVDLRPGQTTTVHFAMKHSDFAHWDVTRDKWVVEAASYEVMVGSSAADIEARAAVVVPGERIPPRDLTRTTRAENFDAYSGVRLVDETKTAGTAVAADAAGQWAAYRDAALGRASTITARVAKATAGAGSIEVHLDAPTGPLVANLPVPSTADPYTYVATTAPFNAATGTHDVYLVFTTDLRLATFALA